MGQIVREVPLPTLRRLPSYLNYLNKVLSTGQAYTSSTYIAQELGFDPTQVRKDLAFTGIEGKPKVGYPIAALIESIKNFLNWDNLNDAFLVGVGKLGLAMLEYEGYTQYGLNIIAAFDNDPDKIGKNYCRGEILPLDKMANLAKRMHIHLGVITVPANHAQEVANIMVAGGIRAILNLAPVSLCVPEGVLVHNENLAAGLALLCRHLKKEG